MTTAIGPSQSELDEIKEQIQEQKRIVEYEQLKRDLEVITHKAVNTPNDLDSAMQVPDTDKVLHSKGKVDSVMDKLITRAGQMCSIQPVLGPVVVIVLILAGPTFINFLAHTADLHEAEFLAKLLPFLLKGSVTMVTIGFVIFRSATRSLLLPIAGVATSAFFCTTLKSNETILYYQFNDFIILGAFSFIALLVSAISVR